MIYPKFIKENSTIGVTAPSNGITDELDLKRLDNAISKLNEKGLKVIETNNVRKGNLGKSSSIKERVKQLESLFLDKDVDAIICASGGEFMMEILSELDFSILQENIKWFQGYSDPTCLTHILTTKYDIATIYGNNIKAFGMNTWHSSLNDNIEILKGNLITQNSFEKYEGEKREQKTGLEEYNLTADVNWKSLFSDETYIKGRMLGGCLDVINELFGTRFDKTKEFIEKYKDDGIIWYFDNFDLNNEQLYRTFWKFKDSGYFNYTKGIIFGRSLIDESYYGISFEDTIKEFFKDLNIPIIIDADLGHISPRITIINGAIGEINCKNSKGEITFYLE